MRRRPRYRVVATNMAWAAAQAMAIGWRLQHSTLPVVLGRRAGGKLMRALADSYQVAVQHETPSGCLRPLQRWQGAAAAKCVRHANRHSRCAQRVNTV